MIESYMMAQDTYTKLITKELVTEKALLEGITAGGATAEHLDRVRKRIELIEQELSGQPPEEKKDSGEGEPVRAEDVKIQQKPTKPADVESSPAKRSKESEFVGIYEMKQTITIDQSKVDKESFAAVKKRLDEYAETITYLQNVTPIATLAGGRHEEAERPDGGLPAAERGLRARHRREEDRRFQASHGHHSRKGHRLFREGAHREF